MKKLAVIALLLLSGITKAQVYVSETREGNVHTFEFFVDGSKCMEEVYVQKGEELIAHGLWEQYDSNGFVVAKYKYKDGDLVSVSMFVNQYWITKQI